LPEVVGALEFIEQIHTRPLHQVPVGDRVAVIGGGNTAIDAVTQARRLGARDAAIVYRRSQADMPAYDFEQKLAKTDGARFLFNVVPLEILSDGTRHVTGLKLARTASTNGKLQVLAGSEFTEPFDMVIKAIGEEKQVNLFKKLFPALELDKRGVVVRNPDTGQTNIPRVFTGGDCANGGREVVNAVAEGKKAARGIHALLAGENVPGPMQPSRHGVKGVPVGSGFDRPIRVRELEKEYAKHKSSIG
jgi:glutamate synthase (NADPH/NADH) small chain